MDGREVELAQWATCVRLAALSNPVTSSPSALKFLR